MKYAPGTLVVVTTVPDRAKLFVVEGTPATVLDIRACTTTGMGDEAAKFAEDAGLTLVLIGNFTFWWKEDDLGLSQ
jgi:hypothetical protein